MGEIVNGIQERTIPEYELMRKHQVFPDEKIRGIVKTRENYQYKLSRNAKSLKDYGEYIIYEKKIHGMVTAIETSRKEKFPGLKAAMSNRIVRLYKEALRGFPDESRLWEAYLKFCKANFVTEVPNAYEKLLQKQGDKPQVWCNAAMWFHSQGNNMEKVKNLFFRGLQRHPESEMLYSAFFNVLLLETAGQTSELREASLARVTAIYNTAKKKICHVTFLLNLVKQCEEEKYMPFSKPLQKLIINDMMEMYPREELVWDLLAQRELRGSTLSDYLDDCPAVVPPLDASIDIKDDNPETAAVIKRTLKRRIEMCFSIYQTAVHTLKTPKMWKFFITAMMELNTDLSTQQVLKRKKLAIAFRGAHENNCMSEDHYYAYINLLTESKSNRDFILNVMNEAVERNPKSFKLWEQTLTFYIMENNEPLVYTTFRKSNESLGKVSYPLWKLTLQYYQTRYDDQCDKLVEIYREACCRSEPEFLIFRPQYLEWSVVNQPFSFTRKLYTELMAFSPPCLELHQKMALLESQALKPDVIRMRQCYENAVNDFGTLRTDVWIDYIKFERDGGEPKRVAGIYDRARQNLSAKFVDNFITEHCLLSMSN